MSTPSPISKYATVMEQVNDAYLNLIFRDIATFELSNGLWQNIHKGLTNSADDRIAYRTHPKQLLNYEKMVQYPKSSKLFNRLCLILPKNWAPKNTFRT